MVISRLIPALGRFTFVRPSGAGRLDMNLIPTGRTMKNGGIMPEPHRTPFGLLRVIATVITGLLVGAAISKNIANFLEENDLFVPEDDDDDD